MRNSNFRSGCVLTKVERDIKELQAGIALGSQPRLDKVLVKFEVEFGVGELDPLLLESHYAKFQFI